MRILLIKVSHLSGSMISVPQPLGILTLGTLLKQSGDDVRLADYRLGRRTPPVERLVKEFDPDLVGISALTTEAASLRDVVRRVKVSKPAVPLIVGGPHATSYPDEVMADPAIDYAMVGEADTAFLAFRGLLGNGGDPAAVPGLVWRNGDGKMTINSAAAFLSGEELDRQPQPAWELLDNEGYFQRKSMSLMGPSRSMAVFTSRACPYQCTYCHHIFGKGFRARSPRNVIDELVAAHEKLGIKYIEVLDDNFNADRRRSIAILEGLVKRKLPLKLTFPNGLRGDLLTPDLVDLYADAGTVFISWAIETASPRLQHQIRKNLNLERLAIAIRQAVKRRIFSNAFLMLGFPTETYAEAKRTIEYVCDLPLHAVIIHLVTPFRGTVLGDEVGDLIVDPVKQADYFSTSINVSAMTDRQLFNLAKFAYLRFYGNPVRMIRLLKDHPEPLFLPRLAKVMLSRLLTSHRLPEKEVSGEMDSV